MAGVNLAPVGDEPDPEALYTIDELAAASGVPSRTIRFYQSNGTLPSPERRGRVAYYRPEHVERLRVIAELQDRGLRLDAIRDALEHIESGGGSLRTWLGIGDELQTPWSDDQPMVAEEQELIDRFGGDRPGIIADLRRFGLIERQGNTRPARYVVASPGLLDVAVALDRAGVDATTAMEASGLVRRSLSSLSDELVEFFSDRIGHGFTESGEPDQIVRAYEALRPQGQRALDLIFAHEMERSLREFVERGGAMPIQRSRRHAHEAPPADG
jgi:DNA-binding transcriptional MerR regulator